MAKNSKPFARISLKAAEVFRLFLGAGFPMFVLFLVLASFDCTDASSTAPSPSPPSHASTCDEDGLQRNVSILLRYLVSLILASLLMMAFVWGVAKMASKDHERAAAKEDAYYQAACDEAEQAMDAHDKATSTAETLQAKRVFTEAVSLARFALLKKGIARVDGWWKIFVRGAFLLAVGCSFGAAVIASMAFYSFLQIKLHCVKGPAEICTFLVVGVVSAAAHVFFAWIAVSQD